jgi:hypothetical protein
VKTCSHPRQPSNKIASVNQQATTAGGCQSVGILAQRSMAMALSSDWMDSATLLASRYKMWS